MSKHCVTRYSLTQLFHHLQQCILRLPLAQNPCNHFPETLLLVRHHGNVCVLSNISFFRSFECFSRQKVNLKGSRTATFEYNTLQLSRYNGPNRGSRHTQNRGLHGRTARINSVSRTTLTCLNVRCIKSVPFLLTASLIRACIFEHR